MIQSMETNAVVVLSNGGPVALPTFHPVHLQVSKKIPKGLEYLQFSNSIDSTALFRNHAEDSYQVLIFTAASDYIFSWYFSPDDHQKCIQVFFRRGQRKPKKYIHTYQVFVFGTGDILKGFEPYARIIKTIRSRWGHQTPKRTTYNLVGDVDNNQYVDYMTSLCS